MQEELKQKQLESSISDGKINDVPDYILDMVAQRAKNYFKNSKERLLGAYSDEAKEKIEKISSHKQVDDPKRRELHREIILDMVGGKEVPQSGQQDIYLFAGPPGSGKSTLREKFDSGEKFGENHPLDSFIDQYKESTKSAVSVDFGIFKDKLPEYKAANKAYKEKYGDMYAVIRSEASGLNEAIQQFTKDAKLPSIREQLMDVDITKNDKLLKEFKGSNLTVIGVTTEPEITRQRVKDRGEKAMKDEEVVRAVKTFSNNTSYEELAKISNSSILVNTDDEKYKTVMTTKNGNVIMQNREEFDKFKTYSNFEAKQTEQENSRSI